MYKVLIADDEPMIRDGLQVLVDWKSLGFEVAALAEDGAKALQILDEQPFDLLITDVRMPKATGIELLKKLRDENNMIRVVAVSGYDEFEYVRTMASLGIDNYLLKPVNEEELTQTLQNIQKKLDRERRQVILGTPAEDLLRENIINRWIYGSIGESELEERADFLTINLNNGPYCAALLRLPPDQRSCGADLKKSIFNYCKNELKESNGCYCSQNYNGETLLLFAGIEDKNKIYDWLAECVNAVHDRFHIQLLICCGEQVSFSWQVAEAFLAAVKKEEYLNLGTRLQVTEWKEIDFNKLSPFSLRLAQYVLEHYQEDLSLKQLSSAFKANAAYIGQLFKRDIGKPFNDYLRMVRLEKAKELLVSTQIQATAIATRVGFTSASYFYQTFRKEFGISPVSYRRTHKRPTD